MLLFKYCEEETDLVQVGFNCCFDDWTVEQNVSSVCSFVLDFHWCEGECPCLASPYCPALSLGTLLWCFLLLPTLKRQLCAAPSPVLSVFAAGLERGLCQKNSFCTRNADWAGQGRMCRTGFCAVKLSRGTGLGPEAQEVLNSVQTHLCSARLEWGDTNGSTM